MYYNYVENRILRFLNKATVDKMRYQKPPFKST